MPEATSAPHAQTYETWLARFQEVDPFFSEPHIKRLGARYQQHVLGIRNAVSRVRGGLCASPATLCCRLADTSARCPIYALIVHQRSGCRLDGDSWRLQNGQHLL